MERGEWSSHETNNESNQSVESVNQTHELNQCVTSADNFSEPVSTLGTWSCVEFQPLRLQVFEHWGLHIFATVPVGSNTTTYL